MLGLRLLQISRAIDRRSAVVADVVDVAADETLYLFSFSSSQEERGEGIYFLHALVLLVTNLFTHFKTVVDATRCAHRLGALTCGGQSYGYLFI